MACWGDICLAVDEYRYDDDDNDDVLLKENIGVFVLKYVKL